MRGKDFRTDTDFSPAGITPAYAGKSSAFIRSSPVNQDPPRLCGEKHRRTVFCDRLSGSPPPMRGKVHAFTCFFPLCRITPAYAGKSDAELRIDFMEQDHPRLCGEKKVPPLPYLVYWGSPPPMRGKGHDIPPFYSPLGITPAYAGKRSSVASLTFPPRDHPRLCGEKKLIGISIQLHIGSPPPMRGKGIRRR